MRIPVLFSWLFLMPICLLFSSFCISAVSRQCLGNQQSLLLQLKNSLIFETASSTKLVHWNQSVDCCSWEGVTCNEGSVIGLNLTNESISSELDNSSSIFRLQYLQNLSLAYNNFSYQIPSQFDKLTNLNYLDMSNNNFNGSIPSFSMCKNLTTISLSKNDLTGQITFTQWEELLNLKVLDLSYNSLEGSIPLSLFSLPLLQKLQLFNNRFSGQLTKLSIVSSYLLDILDLGRNNLEGPIPMFVFELRGLKVLDLSSNNFNGSFQLNVIQTMRNLFYLDLSHNMLVIEYNETNSSLSSFPQILILRLASSKLKTFPISFLINQSRLFDLDLSDNQIHGEIPNWIWKLSRLRSLNLSHNHLETRDLPLLNMSFVKFLDLRSNWLQGKLSVFPEHAEYLDFSLNNFSSVIPASIGDSLHFVKFFSLSRNTIYGSIPRSICNATNLFALDLSDNLLCGTIPQCLIEMSNTLGVLNLRRNNLSGAISNTFPSNCGLQALNLNGNQLEGKLPKSLAKCTSLEVLELGNNHIKDVFPCFLNNISMLHVFILRSNKFCGPIDCSGPNASWPMLQIVDLAANNFTGKLPIKYFYDWKAIQDDKNEAQSQLNHLRFENNSWHIYYRDVVTVTIKGLQVELVKILTIFISLDFSCNNFDGSIPEEVGELKLLYILNLSHNALTGQIPQSLGKLTYLEALDLSSNELTGEIPVQLANGLIFLSDLNLSFNQLVGKIPQIKQFATFLETSYEGNKGLYGFPLKEKGTSGEPGSSPPTFKETHSNSRNAIDWNFLSAELGFIFGFGIVTGPLMFWKRWRICYYKHADDIFFTLFPQIYIRIENRRRRAPINQGRRH